MGGRLHPLRQELPFPWLWGGFVIFIVACGLSHLVHAAHAIAARTPHNWFALSVMIATAVVSLITAAFFTYLLPRILKLTSPAATRVRLERAVEAATRDLQEALRHERVLLREVHHRVKKQPAVYGKPHQPASEAGDARNRIRIAVAARDRVEAMAAVHAQLEDIGTATLRAKPFAEQLVTIPGQLLWPLQCRIDGFGGGFRRSAGSCHVVCPHSP